MGRDNVFAFGQYVQRSQEASLVTRTAKRGSAGAFPRLLILMARVALRLRIVAKFDLTFPVGT